MLSFDYKNNPGRLGNQLFQYAFLRTQAEKLGVKFFWPDWVGDDIFDLQDQDIRAQEIYGINNKYIEPWQSRFYNRENIEIQDHTEIFGFFESEKCFDIQKARNWYSFKKDKIKNILLKYSGIDFSHCTALHVRLGDKTNNLFFYVPYRKYYLEAIKRIARESSTILIFSDDPYKAENYLRLEGVKYLLISDNHDWEDLYLMTQCRDIICGASTFSWWGAWLEEVQKSIIIFPREGLYRVGTFVKNKDFIPKRWMTMHGENIIKDNFILKKGVQKYQNIRNKLHF